MRATFSDSDRGKKAIQPHETFPVSRCAQEDQSKESETSKEPPIDRQARFFLCFNQPYATYSGERHEDEHKDAGKA